MTQSFVAITAAVLAEDKDFCQFLWAGKIKAGRQGGTFISANAVIAQDKFRAYGIVLKNGCMILPQIEPGALQAILKGSASPVPEEYVMDPDMEYVMEEGEPQVTPEGASTT